jgi:dCTP diphosphatase
MDRRLVGPHAHGVADPAGDEDSLGAIAARLRDFRDARDWARFHTPKNLAISIAVECGELLEHFQWLDDEQGSAELKAKGAQVAEELADVAIYVIQLADTLNIPLGDAITAKIDENERRYPTDLARGNATKHNELRVRRVS